MAKKQAAGTADAAPAKSKKSMLLKIAVAVVLLLVAGVAVKLTVLAPKKADAATAVKPKPAPGPVIAMDEMTLNLDGGHFLRMKLSIETTKGTSADLDMTEGTQAVIDVYSNRSVEALTGEKARTATKNALVAKLQTIYPKKILDVFYTEFVMQ